MSIGIKLKLKSRIDSYMLGGYLFGFGTTLTIIYGTQVLFYLSKTNWIGFFIGIISTVVGLYTKKHNKDLIYKIIDFEIDEKEA